MPIEEYKIRFWQRGMMGVRLDQYYFIDRIDNLLHRLLSIKLDHNNNVPIDVHTGVTMTAVRRQEIYDGCEKEQAAIMKAIMERYHTHDPPPSQGQNLDNNDDEDDDDD